MKSSQDDFLLCKPILARGCQLREHEASGVVLIPEGLIRLNDSAWQLIRLCDGQRTLAAILTTLQAEHNERQSAQIKADMEMFVLRMLERKVLVFQ